MSEKLSAKTPTVTDLAKKYRKPLSKIKAVVAAGAKVEKEHTKSKATASEIARDHAGERLDYYDRLKKMVEETSKKQPELDKKELSDYLWRVRDEHVINKRDHEFDKHVSAVHKHAQEHGIVKPVEAIRSYTNNLIRSAFSTQKEEKEMTEENNIEEAALHPMALHVSLHKHPKTKLPMYKVHKVGSQLADGIKAGEHLSDTELDDAIDIGAKVKHIKEEAMIDEAAAGKSAKDRYTDYHKDIKGLLDGIHKGLQAHKARATEVGPIHWGHVGDMQHIKRTLEDLHDSLHQKGEYLKPARLGEDVTVSAIVERMMSVVANSQLDEGRGRPRKNPDDPKWAKKDGAKKEGGESSSSSSDDAEPDKHIHVQLSKAADGDEKGGAHVTFADGKTHFVKREHANLLLRHLNGMKPEHRAQAHEVIGQSHDHLQMAVGLARGTYAK